MVEPTTAPVEAATPQPAPDANPRPEIQAQARPEIRPEPEAAPRARPKIKFEAHPPAVADNGSASVTLEPALPNSIGTIIAVSGSKADIILDEDISSRDGGVDQTPLIGTLLSIDTGDTFVLCLITSLTMQSSAADKGDRFSRIVRAELVGELIRDPDGFPISFRRGVSISPRLGGRVHAATRDIMNKAYHFGDDGAVEIGVIHQDPTIPAVVKVDEMLSKHFAVVGSTGSGKSCTVALLLRQVLDKLPNGRIVLLDPHNEYGNCFGDAVELVRLSDLSLPYWVLTFEEVVETIIGNTEKFSEEVDVLRDFIPLARQMYAARQSGQAASTRRSRKRGERYSVDVPTPYLISDVVKLIEEHMGKLGERKNIGPYKRLKARIESISQDPRFEFMFGNLTVQDNFSEVLRRLFRIPVAGRPLTVIQLMGLPSEIVNVLVSVMARLAFDVAMASGGKIPITFVCEEAHRYVPRDSNAGFEPTKRALSQIAKEGRKYGASLGVISQRPGDIDPTILSQCSTVFTMRLSNERDQKIVQSALSDASASLLEFLPTLGTRETIVFGEGVTLPSRILLAKLPPEALPSGGGTRFVEAWADDIPDDGLIDQIIHRWRVAPENDPEEEAAAAGEGENPAQAVEVLNDVAAEMRAPAPMAPVAQREPKPSLLRKTPETAPEPAPQTSNLRKQMFG
ncbi:MAG: helicase HerA domain-containing protein [Alphaproteobacteria bacterium]